jgi:flagellar biosynthesis component FlhA
MTGVIASQRVSLLSFFLYLFLGCQVSPVWELYNFGTVLLTFGLRAVQREERQREEELKQQKKEQKREQYRLQQQQRRAESKSPVKKVSCSGTYTRARGMKSHSFDGTMVKQLIERGSVLTEP